MRKIPFFLLILLCFSAMAEAPVYRFQQDGTAAEFELAMDELAARDADGTQVIKRIGARDKAAVLREAKELGARSRVEHSPVLYKKGSPRSAETRRIVTGKILVRLKSGADAKLIAARAGAKFLKRPRFPPGHAVFVVPSSADALDAADALQRVPGVISAEPLLAKIRFKRFIPDDPLFGKQWHLRNIGQKNGLPGIDVNAAPAWDFATGLGITIGVVDDGLQSSHPDLAPNADTLLDFDWNDNDTDATPLNSNHDFHGTACAGLAGGAGNNGIGITGAAWEATLVGLRLISEPVTDLDEAEAMAHENDIIDIKTNSWGPVDNGALVEGPGPLTIAAIADAVESGRGGLGTIFVWAAGNGAEYRDNSNFDGYANRKEVIAVGSVNDRGGQAGYSESGANLLVVTPSSDFSDARQEIVTTDLTGTWGYNRGQNSELNALDYTRTFGGTSASAPLLAGVAALILEANPGLGWRDVQEILLSTATIINPADAGWHSNGAGLAFNHRFGAGLVDAAAAVSAASSWTPLPPELLIETQDDAATSIPDNNSAGITRTFQVDTDLRVEHVLVDVDITHARRGDLVITLISPSGHQSVLATKRPRDTNADLHWTFGSVQHWGESSVGTWQVRVADVEQGKGGTINSLSLRIYGSSDSAVLQSGATAITAEESPANDALEEGETVTVALTIKNNGQTASGTVVGTLQPTGGVLSPSGPQDFGVIPAGGMSTREFVFRVGADCATDAQLTLTLVQDGTIQSSVLYRMPVGVRQTTSFGPAGPINIRNQGTAAPYPSVLSVSGAIGTITKVTVHVHGFAHKFPRDVDMMLVSPSGDRAMLMSDVGGASPVTGVDLVFDDAAAAPLSINPEPISGTYRPVDYQPKADELPGFPKNTPRAPARLGVFNGTNPNGAWKLYIADDFRSLGGQITDWSLEITTADCPP
jgi:subtilisin-like proprotein convertase family protein